MENFQTIGQSITFIAVRAGQVHVVKAEVASVLDSGAEVVLEEELDLQEGGLVSLNYALEGHQWRAKAVIDSAVGADVRLTLRGNPSRGESRDFIRAQLEMKAEFHSLGEGDLVRASAAFEHHDVPSSPESVRSYDINLSGNGLAYHSNTPSKKGHWVGVHLFLENNRGGEWFSAVGKVVRARTTGERSEIALFFEGLSDGEQDQLFDYVSTWYHAKIQLALSNMAGL